MASIYQIIWYETFLFLNDFHASAGLSLARLLIGVCPYHTRGAVEEHLKTRISCHFRCVKSHGEILFSWKGSGLISQSGNYQQMSKYVQLQGSIYDL